MESLASLLFSKLWSTLTRSQILFLFFYFCQTIAALVTLKHLLQKNAKCRCLLENDAAGGSLSGLVVVRSRPEPTYI